jgi:uncharacterized lipoprotein YbaY/uncharacterized membrane protein
MKVVRRRRYDRGARSHEDTGMHIRYARVASACAMLAALAASGCPSEPVQNAATPAATMPTPASVATPMPTQAAPAAQPTIHGRASYRERVKMPPGADFSVRLVDLQLADTPDAVVAATTLADVAGPPYEFTLPYDPAKLRPNGRYGLHAELRGPDGELWFVTDAAVPVTPSTEVIVEVPMVRAAPPAPVADLARSRWNCAGMEFEATFDTIGERVDLALPEGTLSLPQATSASGARYADHRGNEFWTKGNTATLRRAGADPLDCTRTDAPSPWDEAKSRGVHFRAVGNEPGWLVEVGAGETPRLQAQLDYGERRLDIPNVQMLSGLLGYAGTIADGTGVRLVLERETCNDGMSDATYPVSARFEVGDRTYRGCGRFLE